MAKAKNTETEAPESRGGPEERGQTSAATLEEALQMQEEQALAANEQAAEESAEVKAEEDAEAEAAIEEAAEAQVAADTAAYGERPE